MYFVQSNNSFKRILREKNIFVRSNKSFKRILRETFILSKVTAALKES